MTTPTTSTPSSASAINAHLAEYRALGLTLASFSNITLEEFDFDVGEADLQDTGVESQISVLRNNLQRNWIAQKWFRLFLVAEDPDVAWGALKMMLGCADERFLVRIKPAAWLEIVAISCVPFARRLR